MRIPFLLPFGLLFSVLAFSQSDISSLPVYKSEERISHPADWIVHPVSEKAALYRSADGRDLILTNGLLRRSFRVSPGFACFDYRNLSNGQQLLRTTEPEARLILDGETFQVGGMPVVFEKAYLEKAWIDTVKNNSSDYVFSGFDIRPLRPFIPYKPVFWSFPQKDPSGISVSFYFKGSKSGIELPDLVVHYELYDDLPLLVKWVALENHGTKRIKINRVVNEILALVEEESAVVGTPEQMKKQHGIYVETNYAFNNAMRYDISDQTTHWKTDSGYTSQVNYNYQTPCLLEIYPEYAPGIRLNPGESFRSVRTHELLMDSYDRERRGMAIRRMYRQAAPWINANPVFMHLVSRNDAEVRNAIDQCVQTGYEALILSFGSHLDMEDTSKANIRRWKELAVEAHKKGIAIGGYSLFSSRRISDEDDVIDPKTGRPGGAFFGNAPCFGSRWGLAYRDKIKSFFEQTGFDIWENDGPYPGDRCASVNHPGHEGLDDSQWCQMEIQKELYHWLNERGVYINAPDWYFLDGTHKTGIGYREVNFSLSREQQKILNRQNIFDGTWEKTPSMGWGFVPLTRYQGGGPEAILEPLKEHLADYRQLMFQYYGAGVQACYRGPRLFDSDTTRNMVKSMIEWYKKYRIILNSDIIHLRRADGRDWDGILHVNPLGKEKALLLLFNPLPVAITRTIRVPLYYSGLKEKACVREKEKSCRQYALNRDYEIELTFSLEPGGYSWYEVEAAK